MKAVFLDIDGVLQPTYSQERFDHINEIVNVANELDKAYPGHFYTDYVTLEKHPEDPYSEDIRRYNLAAVYYDWSKDAVSCLRSILESTDARIVISSDWRDNGEKVLRSFLAVYELEQYFYGMLDIMPRYQPTEEQIKVRQYFESIKTDRYESRASDIRHYLSVHPEITSYVAIDDLNLGFPVKDHFVYCNEGELNEKGAALAIEILRNEDGPYPINK